MDKREILKKVDHTLLKQTATWEDIKVIIDNGIVNECASVCIPPCFVKSASEYADNKIAICTVIGFPNGYNSTKVKCFETEQAIEDGADEIDMVINIGNLKAQKYDLVEDEIKQLAEICHNNKTRKTLKVIIESCLLSEDEVRKMCEIIAKSGADYIKTSTGFSTDGATLDTILIMKEEMMKWNANEEIKKTYSDRDKIRIKASGGIKNFDDAEEFIKLGADRLGTSRLIN